MDNGLTIAMIVGLLTVALGVLLIALRAGVDQESDKASTRRTLLDIGRLRASFDQAVSTIERNIADRSKRYDIPWWCCCMMVTTLFVQRSSAAGYRMHWRGNHPYHHKPDYIGICSIVV